MLAATIEESGLDNLDYPVYVQPKIDGIRCVILNGVVLSRTLKPIPNKFVREVLGTLMEKYPFLIDGELEIRDESFQEVQSEIMSENGNPNFHYTVFDCLLENNSAPYFARLGNIDYCIPSNVNWIGYIGHIRADNKKDILTAEKYYVNSGLEGIIIRDQHASYKFGRSTIKEGALLKLKRFIDAEAIVLDMEELQHNVNEIELDERGYTKRSSSSTGKISSGKMGALKVRGLNGDFAGVEFNIGSGFTDYERNHLWLLQHRYIGKTLTYKYQKIGSKDKPRIPVFKCWREDL